MPDTQFIKDFREELADDEETINQFQAKQALDTIPQFPVRKARGGRETTSFLPDGLSQPFSSFQDFISTPTTTPMVGADVSRAIGEKGLADRQDLGNDLSLSADFSLYKKGTPVPIGQVNPDTGEFKAAGWLEGLEKVSEFWTQLGSRFMSLAMDAEYNRGPSGFEKPIPIEEVPEEYRAVVEEQRKTERLNYKSGGNMRKLYEQLPTWKRIAWESIPFLPGEAAAVVHGVSATGLRAALAETGKGLGLPGRVGIGAARGLLAPVAGAEFLIAKAFTIPATWTARGLSKGFQTAFEKAMNEEFTHWIVRQGLRGEQAPRFIQAILKRFPQIYDRALANVLKRKAERMGAEKASRQAARDTVKEIERLLVEEHPAVAGQTRKVSDIIRELTGEPPALAGARAELVPRQPWQMTKAEYVKPPYTSPAMHKFGVEKALQEGKPVPAEVLADYPDLKPTTEPIPIAEAGEPEAGIQAGAFGVPSKAVRPVGKGQVTQISMEDQLKLAEVQAAEKPAVEAVGEVDLLSRANVEVLEVTAKDALRWISPEGRFIGLREELEGHDLTAQRLSDTLLGKEAITIQFQQRSGFLRARFEASGNLNLEIFGIPTDSQIKAIQDLVTMNNPSQVFADIRTQEGKLIASETVTDMKQVIPTIREAIVKPPAVEVQPSPTGLSIPPELPPPPKAPEELGRTSPEWTGSMADLQSAEVVNNISFRNDNVRKWVNQLPQLKSLFSILNPSAVANTPPERAIIIRAVLRDEGKQKSQGVFAHLGELGNQEKVFGKVADDGTIAEGVLKGLHPNDIRSFPKKYASKLTDEQKQWIQRANDIEKAKLDFLKRNDIEINELAFEEGGVYAGRRVYARVTEGQVIDTAYVGTGARRPGAKLAAEKQRVFTTAKEATEAGYRYLPEDEALYLNVQGAYNRVADKQMADWLLTQVPWRTTGAPEELVLAAEQAQLKSRHSQQLVAALNRAVRGERVPDATINAIARSYPDQAQELKNLIPLIQAGKPTASEVQNLTRVAKGLVETNKGNAQRAVNARARSREKALRVGFEEAVIPAPAFAGKILTGPEAKETAKVLKESFEPGFSKALEEVNKVNAVARYFMLAGDISPMTIQLLFLMGENPLIHGKAFGGFVKALFSKEFHSSYLTKHKETIDKHPNLLLTKAGATEFTEAMASGGWLSGNRALLPEGESYLKSLGLVVPRTLGKVGATLLTPFQRGFEIALDVAGIEMAEAYDYLATTPENIADLDQFINEFRGVTSSARLGVSPGQQQIETAAILAPRYNRAIAGLLFDLARGGIRGDLARKSMAKGIAAISAIAVLISIASGEDMDEIVDHFNPNSPNFFTWDIAGQRVGPGTKVRSVVKLFAQSVDNPEALFQMSMDNPALRFIRGNLSPVIGSGIDLITGRSYVGDPTRDGLLSFSKEILAGNLLPIWTQSVLLEGGDLKGKTTRGIAEFFGGRGYPEPVWNEVGRLRDKYSKVDFTVKYEELNRGQIDELNRNHPDLKDLEEKAKLEGAEKGDEFEKWLFETRSQITDERNNALEEAAQSLSAGLISKKDYDNERKFARPYYSGGMAVLWGARETLDPFAIKQIEKWMGENQKPEDKALDKYLEFRADLIAKADLPRDWDSIERRIEAYLKQFPSRIREYVLANRNRWIESLPLAARQVELERIEGIENETWWDNYSGQTRTGFPVRGATREAGVQGGTQFPVRQ